MGNRKSSLKERIGQNQSNTEDCISTSGSFSSLGSGQSVERFRWIEGRRFHNTENSVYSLPNDITEQDRLQLQHYLLQFCYKGNFSSPIHDLLATGARVIDLGCGTGSWTMDVATEFPNSHFIGIDISAIQPLLIKPPNVEFIEANILDGLCFEACTFDYAFMRFMSFSFTGQEWQEFVINEIVRVLKPGGWIELAEPASMEPSGPYTQKFDNIVKGVLKKRGIDTLLGERLPSYLTKTGSFGDIHKDFAECCCGKWGGDIGSMTLDNIVTGCISLKPLIMTDSETTSEEIDEYIRTMSKECEINKTYWKLFRIYAQKMK